jgi:cell division septation protein DedD
VKARTAAFGALALAVVALVAGTGRPRAASGRAKASTAASADARHLAAAQDALEQGRVEEARSLAKSLPESRGASAFDDDLAYFRAKLAPDGARMDADLSEYLKVYAHGRHRREATLAIGKLRYVQGEYAVAENVLSVFSPGVEKDFVGREGVIQRGLAQLARGDAQGAFQFLLSAKPDLTGSPEEEDYLFALSQAALRANKPAQATEALRALLQAHPKGDYAPQALYAMGVSLEMVGRSADAAGVFRQVMERFPDSYEATRVRDRGIRLGQAPPAALPLGGGFAIQVGAFSRRDLADALARDLKVAGVSDVSIRQGSETPPIYRVRAGAFSSRDEAQALGERLRRERGFSYTVVAR